MAVGGLGSFLLFLNMHTSPVVVVLYSLSSLTFLLPRAAAAGSTGVAAAARR